MAPVQAAALYTEARLDLASASPDSTIELSCSTTGNLRSPKRVKYSHDTVTSDADESSFIKNHVATTSSIFFRRTTRSPRVFIWRILDERKVLEIQAVDLHQDRQVQGDAILTLRFRFNSPIRPYGVAFADPEDKDALISFIITDAGELFTLALRREIWTDKRRLETESESEAWCKSFSPSAFSFRIPYRLFAISTRELVVSLHDGGLLRLERKGGDDGSHWRDTFFAEGGWGSTFKGLIPFRGHNTIRFGNTDLEPNTASATAMSPDQQHLITTSLDHVLRAWNLQTGRIGMQTDLLGENEITEKKTQYLIGADQTQLMQLVEGSGTDGIQYYVVTFSPKRYQFKIWGILDADSGLDGLRDVRDDVEFVPPLEELLDTSVWTLEEFHFVPKSHWRETQVWLRARSGPVSRVFSLTFDLFADREDLQTVWRSNWVTVDGGSLSSARLNKVTPSVSSSSDEDYQMSTDKWIDFLFSPGRFATGILAAALNAYARPTKAHRAASNPSMSLKQRISEAVVGTASKQHERTQSSGETFESTLSTQWRVFYSLVKDLLKQQSDPLSLVYDSGDEQPWLVLADFVSPLRSFSSIEALRLNTPTAIIAFANTPSQSVTSVIKDDMDLDLVRFLHAIHNLRSSFSAQFQSDLRSELSTLILEEASDDVPSRIHAFDESLGLCAQVSDDEYSRLTESISHLGGYETLDNNIFFAVLDKLAEQIRGVPGRAAITQYGAKFLIRGSQETLQVAIETLLDLVVFVVFLALELEPSDLSPHFQASDLFVELMAQLKEQFLLEWLVTTLRPNHTVTKHRRSSSSINESSTLGRESAASSPRTSAANPDHMTVHTVMESMFIGDWSSIPTPQDEPKTAVLTYWCRAWTYGLDVANNYDELTAHILSHLVKTGDWAIAQDFEKFVPLTPWSGYVKARLALLKGEPQTAAMLFRKSSFGLALSHFDVNDPSPSLLLSPHEKNHFSEGLASYYQHVLSLFNDVKQHSYVIDFANLAFQALKPSENAPQEVQKRRADISTRLFAASMASSRFEEAYACLGDMAPALRKANLTAFFTSLLSTENTPFANGIFKRLPFTTTMDDADAALEALAAKSLNAVTGQGARYHKALYALRVSRGDMRGAATALWTRLQWLRGSGERVADPETTEGAELMRCWLTLINCLACVEPSQAWIFAEEKVNGQERSSFGGGIDFGKPRSSLTLGKGAERKQRTVITLEDVRRLYQRELDRVEAVQEGRYAFDGGEGVDGDLMDVL